MAAELCLLVGTWGGFGDILGTAGCDRGGTQEPLQISLQVPAICFPKACEFEWLQTTLSGPHGKQHRSLAAYRAATYVKHHFYFDSFIQGLLQVQQTTGKGKLVQAGPYLASAFKS